jgi:response regulator RpfG family c-di-GMP phosphodiesterase
MPGILLTEILMGLSSAIDLVSPQMADHHKRVAYIAYSISSEIGLPEKDRLSILAAGLLHDCGAIHDDEKLKTFRFDFGDSMEERLEHCTKSWQILSGIEELRNPAEIIKYHHLYWNEAEELRNEGAVIPLGSYILHLADRVDVLTDRTSEMI